MTWWKSQSLHVPGNTTTPNLMRAGFSSRDAACDWRNVVILPDLLGRGKALGPSTSMA